MSLSDSSTTQVYFDGDGAACFRVSFGTVPGEENTLIGARAGSVEVFNLSWAEFAAFEANSTIAVMPVAFAAEALLRIGSRGTITADAKSRLSWLTGEMTWTWRVRNAVSFLRHWLRQRYVSQA